MATDFEAFTHQQLKAMSDALDPSRVKARAEQLKKAADDIAKIAEELKTHQVTGWEGEGAVAFQEWVGRAGNATLRLSEYSAHGAHWMTQAVQKMYEAQTMPAYDTDAAANLEAARKFRNDPDSRTIGPQAQSKLNSDHTEAVQLMKKLAEAYELSSTQMNKAEIPTFPPPPDVLLPSGFDSQEELARPQVDGGVRDGTSSSVFASRVSSDSPGGASLGEPGPVSGTPLREGNTPPATTGSVLTPTPWIPERDVNVDLDSVATLPPTTLPQAPSTLGQLPTGGGSGIPGGLVPPVPLPPIPGATGRGGPGPGVGHLPGVSGPGAFGGSKVGGASGFAGLPPRDSGIVGGRPVASGGHSAGIPRGTVIGAEGAQAGRGMGGGMGGGLGGGHGAAAGSAAGRRLAMEQGGVVGGRQAGTAGRPATGGQPFTPGGSGLVRNANGGTGSGAVGHAGAGARTAGRRREDQAGERPDYLAEDEETWQGNRRVVPPVID
ncbi:hypothetical protein [Streptomyces sp. NPDC002044]|uniref:WXG100 family type VII secretion target n=1 Tax=Streptomyces sp. NPDC002044 TaxID=3154662 RepID=UPI00331EBBC4